MSEIGYNFKITLHLYLLFYLDNINNEIKMYIKF